MAPGPSSASINVGNHWLTADGARHTYDDGRQRLPAVVAPGERAEVTLRVQAPAEPGRYQFVLDVVQEGVRWFGRGLGPAHRRGHRGRAGGRAAR